MPIEQNNLTDNTWFSHLADQVVATFPDLPLYTCAAGISPSGIVHFGNFRDVITAHGVASELRSRGRTVRMLFSWDEYDRFRKVPADIDQAFIKYIGMPLTAVPDPDGQLESYARHFELPFENAMQEIGITLDYKYQAQKYQAGEYIDGIKLALAKRLEIADILLSFKTEKGNLAKGIEPAEFRAGYYPISLYSRFTGTDKTEIVDYDGGTKLTYRCVASGQSETIDFVETPIVKLPWKIDWAMRWAFEGVNFEPGGKDHASPGGSYDVSKIIAKEIFDTDAPIFQGYEFVGVQGIDGKMSGSKGNAVSPATLLEIYEPTLLKWLYLRRAPRQAFNLAFDSEIYRQYDELDRAVADFGSPDSQTANNKVLAYSGITAEQAAVSPIPFKQAVALGQITQWNQDKLNDLLVKLGVSYDPCSLETRLAKAKTWLERYNPEESIALLSASNLAYLQAMDEAGKGRIERLRTYLAAAPEAITELETQIYAIPKNPAFDDKETKQAQRAFFKDVYNLLIGKDTGPRLSTFLWAVDRGKTLQLLSAPS